MPEKSWAQRLIEQEDYGYRLGKEGHPNPFNSHDPSHTKWGVQLCQVGRKGYERGEQERKGGADATATQS